MLRMKNKQTEQKPIILQNVTQPSQCFRDKLRLYEWARSSLKDSMYAFWGKKKEKDMWSSPFSVDCIRLSFWLYQTLTDVTGFSSSLIWQHNTARNNLRGGDFFGCVLFRNTFFSWVPVFEVVPGWSRLTVLEDMDISAALTRKCSF